MNESKYHYQLVQTDAAGKTTKSYVDEIVLREILNGWKNGPTHPTTESTINQLKEGVKKTFDVTDSAGKTFHVEITRVPKK